MRRWTKIACVGLTVLSVVSMVWANTTPYLDQEQYKEAESHTLYEDIGVVLEHEPELGYIVYRNRKGEKVQRTYYRNEITVEKDPYYESEDRIGYIDELFPYFKFDPRDTNIESIKPGDVIYIRTNKDKIITYISAYNDYQMVYGKVHTWDLNMTEANLTIQDEKGVLLVYSVPLNTPITKKGGAYSLSRLKEGDWVKVLVAKKILGAGIIEEEVMEIVVDQDTRYISNIYKGDIASIDAYKNMLNIKNAQDLTKSGWGSYKNILSLKFNPNTVEAYKGGIRVSADYIARHLKNTSETVYVAAEQFMGKETAAKLNFQQAFQNTLPATTIIDATPSTIRLLSGENLTVGADTLIVRDKRLIEPHSIMVGDYAQVVVSGENKAALINITSPKTTGELQIYRGRIKKITERENFEVETVSLLQNHLWYFHPTPRSFTIDYNTKFYTEDGPVANGIEDFLGYGENSRIGAVYTIVTVGDKATVITDSPYHTESIKGTIYEVGEDGIKVKDLYYYQKSTKNWALFSNKNVGASIMLSSNSVIVKEGKVVPMRLLEPGDKIIGMVDVNIKNATGDVTASIIVVQ